MAAKDFIVAIELGSSTVTGIAGKKNRDGSVSVLAVVKEDSSSFIRKGVVYNIDKTAHCLTNVVNKLTKQLKTEILRVYVGVGGQSIRSQRNVIARDLSPETKVTQEMVIDLMDANRYMKYPDQEILDVATQEYKVDSQLQIDPVGIQCSRLEGNFLNILGRKAFSTNLNKCFETAGINVADMYLAPLALADAVLTETEKRSGCVLVDLGAGTTTVSVYTKNILRHLAVIPLGGNNITKDIASLQMEESEAERLKLEYASAYTDSKDIDPSFKLKIDDERSVSQDKFVEIVEGRLVEIIGNVWCQIPSEYYDKLLGGIVLTGGGANMKNIEKAFMNYTHIDKVRVAKTVSFTVNSSNADVNARNAMMNTVIGLLAKGGINCAGNDLNAPAAPFVTQTPPAQDDGPRTKARQPHEIPTGVVLTEAEREAARLKKEAEEKAAREKAEEERRRIEEEKRKNSRLNKIMRKLKDFGKQMIDPEEER